ncbi:mannose-1-phosphate guanylyltransferase [Thermodesulfomicrobium sp. WS]|nr:mannose-1-phosphate guanylyltransferase [Thermodesulfomicrobium sp. WS]
MALYPVILAGGSGTRLWPLSRKLYPKQLLPLLGKDTLLQMTWKRLAGLGASMALVLCSEEHRFIVAEQLREIGAVGRIILEPVARNTAPAVAVAALAATCQDPEAVLVVLPADHAVDEASFQNAVHEALPLAEAGHLVTFGVPPTRPETGYGYIQRGEALPEGGFRVVRFVEKPDADTARRYCDSGEYWWNSGMFVLRADVVLAELERFEPDMVAACRSALGTSCQDLDFLRLDAEKFAASPEKSIDYAVMERTDRAAVLPLATAWSDLGSWDALWEAGAKDASGNVVHGDVLLADVHDSFVHAESRLVAAVGLADHIVVETVDAVLVAPRHRVQEVKQLVDTLKAHHRPEAVTHRKVFRPWGNYESIDAGDRYQVKRITVLPGQVLSLQKHFHRAEHWVVVRGTAMVTRGQEQILLRENESIYIPLGTVHRLENPGRIPLELIEVQVGPYLGEDDIVRLEDVYGRNLQQAKG